MKYIFILIIASIISCNTGTKNTNKGKPEPKANKTNVPTFNADSAYHYVAKQVEFGPRVPNTEAHVKCAEYLANKLRSYGSDVIVQEAKLKAFDNTILNAKNIIGQFNPESKNRVLLFAHWDSRPFADRSEDLNRKNEPILGANDGGSGVGVLLEVARQIQKNAIDIGVDIIFFDAEDYGMPDHLNLPYKPDTWCLGSQYWGKNPHKPNYYAKYGILLDMVGAKGATFHQELYSLDFNRHMVKKVWNTAHKLGFGNYFIYEKGGYITDDHLYVTRLTGIPSINIIQYDQTTNTSFGSYWHTHNDNMDIIDKNTLYAVGQTLLHVIYNE